jgi:hypothetical protein
MTAHPALGKDEDELVLYFEIDPSEDKQAMCHRRYQPGARPAGVKEMT